jgi:PAS domain S-box-containing protein
MKKIKLGPDTYWNALTENVTFKNETIPLSHSMKTCVRYLILKRGRPAESQDLFNFIWDDYEREFNPKSVRNLISELRKKIPCLLITNHYGGRYSLEKYREPFPDIHEYFFDILDQAKHGITITDPNQDDNPTIYTNEAFAHTFGYSTEEVLGRNPRYLQNEDRDQPELADIRKAIELKTDITTVLRNYHKNGTLIYNEVTISPIFDKKTLELKYFLGIQRDITKEHKRYLNTREIHE